MVLVKKKLVVKNNHYFIDDEKDNLGISVDNFIDMLKDESIFTQTTKQVIRYFYLEENHQATSKYIIDKYHIDKKNFNGIIVGLGKRICKWFNHELIFYREDCDEPVYWCILFNGWYEVGTNNFVWKVRDELVEAIEKMHLFECSEENINDESLATTIYREGRVIGTYATRYERKVEVRDSFIRYFIAKRGRLYCEACGFNFEETYGTLGSNFIEVHHNKPISSFNDEHEIDIKNDLNCLCSNCHRMIHHIKGNVLTVDKLKEIILLNKN